MTTATLWRCSNQEYHAETEHVSNSALKVFMQNPKVYHDIYVARTRERKPPSKEMILGSLFHALVLEGEIGWKVWSGADRRTKAGKEAWDNFAVESLGFQVLTQEENDTLFAMHDSLWKNDHAAELLNAEGDNETSMQWTHPSGVKLKCRWDRLCHNGTQVDIKTVSDPSPEFFAKSVDKFRYDVQAAFYSQGLESLAEFRDTPFRFIAVCTEWPHECYVYRLPEDALQIGHETVNRELADLARRHRENDWVDPYMRGVNEVNLPAWFYSQKGLR